MGDRTGPAEYLHGLIRRTKPNARKLLELACGTGSMLKHLGRYYEVSGIDLSRHMLSVARRKVPQAKLFQQNMVTFSLPERFDVICCVFDSINHIALFSDWKKLFANVQRHLLPGGFFIFDINTQRKLDRHIAEPPWVHWFGNNLLIMNVTALANHASNWNIEVFERVRARCYALHEENVVEVSFSPRKIVTALKMRFAKVKGHRS